ncbi:MULTISPECIES: Mov34/MPN/PAD-1 family protein [Marinomonas]|uniref:Mov34/MPN/PAD-1 family protein n=1 Tax=Marinomonas rhodophyticola TaxID=2992803 RepID=A0ABT3KFT9_9GAMM|nr:Mov34/MPN/PAD-1 family protein [Marinomonas sp. KJ51-3]MCW4629413.1 Mov34/MPN/PAD-1 family protein [Marinomonas sp. KJ51-3]
MQSLNRFVLHGGRLWSMNNGGYVYIDQKVLETIDQYRQIETKVPESGGFLCGYYKGVNLHVIDLTVPQPKDIQRRCAFQRLDPKHVDQARDLYINSGGKINCLGEWHTHPEKNPTPSYIDRQGWNIFNRNRPTQPAIFLIAGTQEVWIGAVKY